ncbi:MAG: hypothetical protein JRF33_09130 [Deltaproteobacteria bacterium]|nr:hypothetical protein [Deltaproteobacteria bacterium]
MVRGRPASIQHDEPKPRALDVSTTPLASSPIIWILIIASLILVDLGKSHARSLALISPPSQNHARARQVRRLHAQLSRQLQARGIEVVGERVFSSTARGLGLNSKTALHKDRLPEICDALRIDGVLIVGLARRGRMMRLSAFLFDATGRLTLKRQKHQRRAKATRRWLRQLARTVDRRLSPARPPLEEVAEPLPESMPIVPMGLHAKAAKPQASAKESDWDWQPAVEVGVESLGTSNLYADSSQQMDLAVHPWLDLGLDLASNWAMGYRAELRTWLRKEDLLQHAHRIYAAKGYGWGIQGQHSLVLLANMETSLNRETYQNLDFIRTAFQAALDFQALEWLSLQATGRLGGRIFLHDKQSNSLDTDLRAGLGLRLPAGWRVGISAQADARLYTQSSAPAGEANDLQVGGDLRLSGPLWSEARMTAKAGYRLAIGDSHQVQRILAEAQIRALGDTFLSSGPRASLRVLQKLGKHNQVSVSLRYQENDYAGWPALDEQGQDLGLMRKDRRLGPSIAFGHGWWPEQQGGGLLQFEYSLRVEYGFTRQWSNGPWTDTAIHMLGLQFQGAW